MPADRANQALAAEIIETARERHVPVLTVAEAARRTGITPEGWRKVIKAGRGREGTLLAMARVTSTEADVRSALGLPALTGDAPPLPDMTPEERRRVLSYIEGMRAAERGA